MGKQVTVRHTRQYRPFSHTFLGTALWVLPLMAVLLVGGFRMARDYLAPRYLEPGSVQSTRPDVTRINTPEEARRAELDQSSHVWPRSGQNEEARQAAHDQPSPVWTHGVQSSDIPKLLPTEQPKPSPDRPAKRVTRPDAAPADSAPTADAPASGDDSPAPPADHPAPSASSDDDIPLD